MSNYSDLLNAVEQYYGSGSDEWKQIEKYGIAAPDAARILKQVPGVDTWVNANGSVRSYNYTPIENITSGTEQAINSNVPATIKSFEIPSNSGIETVTSETGETVKQMTFKSGMKQAGSFVFGEIAPRVAAVATGITVGKTFDKLLYSVNPDFWDEHGMSTLNPDVWGDIIGTDSVGDRVLNAILGTTPDGKTQAYIDQEAFAYMVAYLNNKNVFAKGDETYSKPQEAYKDKFFNYDGIKNLTFHNIPSGTILYQSKYGIRKIDVNSSTAQIFLFSNHIITNPTNTSLSAYVVSENPFTLSYTWDNNLHTEEATHYTAGNSYSLNDFYAWASSSFSSVESCNSLGVPYTITDTTYQNQNNIMNDLFALTKYGTHDVGQSIDGIGNQDGAKTPDLSGDSSVEDVLDSLKEQFPELWDNAVEQDVVQPDGSIKTYVYVPVAMPDIDENGNPISSSSTQADSQVQPETATKSLLDLITKIIQRNPPTNPPDTGDGDTPPVVPPSGSASSLYAIYNPTLSQINSFGAWLWTDNFVDQIKKLFNDPMQAIIGLHKVYATPATGGAQTIKVGYLDSGVSAKVVSNQYTTIDCGSVSLSEYFGNVFDYEPYTKVNLYLPFIGIVPLSVGEVMRSTIHVVYHVDVLTGACLAEVKIKRDSAGGTLFQYSGNAAVQYPISSGSYMGIISGIMSIAGGVAGTIATGGAAMPVLLGAGASIGRMHTDISHSGNFSGNAGAMGIKKPYLIIDRPQTALAKNFPNYIGYPSNTTVKLSSCSGFTKVREIHLENVPATNNELSDIEMKLKGGIII